MMKGQQRARINAYNIDPLSCCDRCGEIRNRSDLAYQFVYAGNALVKTGSLVCSPCLDIPFPNNRPIKTGPDPVPIADPRPAPWAQQMGYTDPTIPQVWPAGYDPTPAAAPSDSLLADSGDALLTEDGDPILVE